MNSDGPFDVFLCHNSKDKRQVRIIKEQLEKQNIRCFLDEGMGGGTNWEHEINCAMSNSKSVAIFVGSDGLGNYQKQEIEDLYVRAGFNEILVIPVLLPNATQESEKSFRSELSIDWIWGKQQVDFRKGGDENPGPKLIDAIRGTNSQNNQARSTQSKTQEDDLSSERGVDYTRLRDLLKARNWREADEETFKVMLQAARREQENSLDLDSIKNFPCTDLRTIDQLWVKYSEGRFGFSVQKRIWKNVGEDYRALGLRVGWRSGDWLASMWKYDTGGYDWYRCDELNFSLNAPVGHLPWVGGSVSPIDEGGSFRVRGAVFSRVEICKV